MKRQLLSLALIISGGISTMFAQAPLLFSEYAEGTSHNKYLEIYNPTADTVDLAEYAFPSVANDPDLAGSYEYWNTFDGGASIAPGDVYIIAHGSSDSLILMHADQTHNYLSNGDDGYALVYGTESDYQIIDFIGDFNGDPGAGWAVAGVPDATKDHTLVRKFSVSQGNSDWLLSAGTNTDDSEWLVFDQNDWSYIGSHTQIDIVVTGLGCTDSLALNFDPLATEDDGSCIYDTVQVLGCTDQMATNYNEEATEDDGSCEYEVLELSISGIQGMMDSSPYEGQSVSTSGTVTAVTSAGYFIQDAVEAWSGIFVYDSVNVVEMGYEIALDAEVAEYYGMTQLKNVSSFVTLNAFPTDQVLPITNLSAPIIEDYEGCLVTISNACVSVNNEYGEAEFNGVFGGAYFKTNDLLFLYDFELSTYYEITGVVEYSFGEYKICPRNIDDVYTEVSVKEIDASTTSIKMINNVLELESTLVGNQEFKIYNILGETVLQGVFDTQLAMPMYHLQTATYIVRVGNYSQMVIVQ